MDSEKLLSNYSLNSEVRLAIIGAHTIRRSIPADKRARHDRDSEKGDTLADTLGEQTTERLLDET